MAVADRMHCIPILSDACVLNFNRKKIYLL